MLDQKLKSDIPNKFALFPATEKTTTQGKELSENELFSATKSLNFHCVCLSKMIQRNLHMIKCSNCKFWFPLDCIGISVNRNSNR